MVLLPFAGSTLRCRSRDVADGRVTICASTGDGSIDDEGASGGLCSFRFIREVSVGGKSEDAIGAVRVP